MKSIFDPYTLKARVFPAFLLFLPASLAIMAWAPEIKIPVVALFGISGNIALSFFISERVRDLGKRKEHALWIEWGGTPTTQLLRHKNPEVTDEIRNGWRKALEAVLDAPLPSAGSESKSPKKADDVYEAAIGRLRELTREVERFPIVFKENVSYGFRRNLWALKPTGIVLSIAGSFACAVRIIVANLNNMTFDPHTAYVLVLCVFMLVWWAMVITKSWIRTQAFEYAKRLLGASFLLLESKNNTSRSRDHAN
jgi:hypothetical protein